LSAPTIAFGGGVSSRSQPYTFAFEGASISQAAQEVLGSALGLNYTIDPEVTGKITLRIDQKMSQPQLFEAFEAALEANGVTMVRTGDSVVLEPVSKAKTSIGIQSPAEGANAVGYSVVAVPLSYANPSDAAKALDAMGRKNLVIYTDDKLGLVVLGGTSRELSTAEDTLHILDQSGLQGSRVRWIDLDRASAKDVSQELDQILRAAGATGVTIVPLTRLNGLLVFARTAAALDEVGVWVQKLDVPSKEEKQGLWIYRPVNLSADSLAATLRSVFSAGGQASTAPPSPDSAPKAGAPAPTAVPSEPSAHAEVSAPAGGESSSIRIGVNKDSNTLVIAAANAQWIQIQQVLDQIDRPPGQVMIEASILEVTLTKELKFGVDWSLVGAGSKLTGSFVDNAAGSIAQQFPGLSVNYLSKTIDATVSALSTMSDVQVVSAPKLMVLDNHTAKLEVGDQVPISTQNAQSTSAAGAPLVVSTDYKDTGVILNVTPRISGDDQVALDVDQQVSDVAQTTSSDIDSPTIEQRHLSSTLLMKDGSTVALGGLISTGHTKTTTGIPYLTKIPWIGNAFKSTDDQTNRTELIVLITAKIVKDPKGASRVMDALEADMKEIQSRGMLKP
jgi:general secretion pathway protein D